MFRRNLRGRNKNLKMLKLHETWSVDYQEIIKIIATRCCISRLKCTKFESGCGSAPDLAGGAYSAPSGPLAGFKGPYF